MSGFAPEVNEDTAKALLLSHGPLKSFHLVTDKESGKSKGYAFCEYINQETTDKVVKAVNGLKFANTILSVKLAGTP